MKDDWIKVQLLNRGITDKRVIDSFKKVYRRDFLSAAYKAYSESDSPLPIGYNQTISQPYIVAYMLEKLTLKKTDNVLEIGTGSGYQTALLAYLASHVTSIEREPSLMKLAQTNLKSYDFKNITLKVGDGALGETKYAPYDKIIVSCASNVIPLN
jgi:protein-L-isoaspartate(D-aspartate) O-methyltransferase